ncbi:hypothetical protein FA13DRAFT_1710006 [Coprinellus micaceus]|uniref:Uncharacterized protein n=1 Tax=Coprinellus micaceus TaxID=71717 RepID=A0A4Y7TAH6_COPMI|nr:hypothetical protein FA13DRAFT_1710006 [Coprinellus micaceus]
MSKNDVKAGEAVDAAVDVGAWVRRMDGGDGDEGVMTARDEGGQRACDERKGGRIEPSASARAAPAQGRKGNEKARKGGERHAKQERIERDKITNSNPKQAQNHDQKNQNQKKRRDIMIARERFDVEVKVKGRRTGLELGRPPPSSLPLQQAGWEEEEEGASDGGWGARTINDQQPARSPLCSLYLRRSLSPPLSLSLIQNPTQQEKQTKSKRKGTTTHAAAAAASHPDPPTRAPKLDRNPLAPPAREEGLGEALRSRAAAVFVGGEEGGGGEASMFAFWFCLLGVLVVAWVYGGTLWFETRRAWVEREERKKKEEDPTPCSASAPSSPTTDAVPTLRARWSAGLSGVQEGCVLGSLDLTFRACQPALGRRRHSKLLESHSVSRHVPFSIQSRNRERDETKDRSYATWVRSFEISILPVRRGPTCDLCPSPPSDDPHPPFPPHLLLRRVRSIDTPHTAYGMGD